MHIETTDCTLKIRAIYFDNSRQFPKVRPRSLPGTSEEQSRSAAEREMCRMQIARATLTGCATPAKRSRFYT